MFAQQSLLPKLPRKHYGSISQALQISTIFTEKTHETELLSVQGNCPGDTGGGIVQGNCSGKVRGAIIRGNIPCDSVHGGFFQRKCPGGICV